MVVARKGSRSRRKSFSSLIFKFLCAGLDSFPFFFHPNQSDYFSGTAAAADESEPAVDENNEEMEESEHGLF